MSMKKGNWIPVSRDVIYKLSPYAKDGQYCEQSAYLSLREDLEKDEVKGLRDYARMWGWSPKKTYTFFEKIGYKTGQTMETIRKQNGNNQETVNLIIYNDLLAAKETKWKQNGNNQETHTINPNPNPNKKNKTNSGKMDLPPEFDCDSFRSAFDDFVQHRKSMKGGFTERAKNLIIKEVQKLSEGNTEKAIAILEQSIMRGWKGVFALSNNQNPKQTNDGGLLIT